MADLQKALELERLRYLHRLEELNKEERNRIAQIKADASKRGVLQSGGTCRAITTARADKVRALMNFRITLRKELVLALPYLGSEVSLNQLRDEMGRTIHAAFAGLGNAFPQMMPATNAALEGAFEQEIRELHAQCYREFEMLKREIGLDLHKKPEQANAVTVTTTGGAAIINLAPIYGHVQQVIGNVGEQGQTELADALRKLADAISATEELRDERAHYLDQIRFMAEQATLEPEKRQRSVIKGLLTGLGASLQNVANVATVLTVAGPTIARHFGFQWPL